MEVPSEEPTAEEEMISSDMDDLDDPLTADSQSLGLGSPPPLATGLFRGRFAGESESPSMASELESGRPSPAADSLEQAGEAPRPPGPPTDPCIVCGRDTGLYVVGGPAYCSAECEAQRKPGY